MKGNNTGKCQGNTFGKVKKYSVSVMKTNY
jgi:hypothetical protein